MADLIDRCGHCGRDGTVKSVKHVTIQRRPEVVQLGPGDTMDVEFQTVIEVAHCRTCGKPTFIEYGWVDGYFDTLEDALDVRVLYPARRQTTDLPERVQRRYIKLLEMLHAPDAFAVRAGQCLEAVCADQGVAGKDSDGRFVDLSVRLDALVKKGHLPRALGDQAHLVRKYRNLGGHDSDIEPTSADVPLIRDFVEALLDFLYWGPAKLARGNAELKQRQDALTTDVTTAPEQL